MEGASDVRGEVCGFSQKTRAKKWQGGHFLGAFRGSALRLHSSGRAAHSRRNGLRPPLQSLPCLNLQLPRHPPQKKRSLIPIRSPSPVEGPRVNQPPSSPKQARARPSNPCRALICNSLVIHHKKKQSHHHPVPEPSRRADAETNRHHPKTNLPPTHSKTPLSLPCSDTAIFVRRKLPS